MGEQEKNTQTELGIKYIGHYFIISIIVTAILTIYGLFLFIQGTNLIEYSNSNFSFLLIVIFITLFTILFLIRGLIYFFNGRAEYNDEHQSNVIVASILIIVYITTLLVNSVYSKGYYGGVALISAASAGFSSNNLIPFITNIALSTATYAIFGFSLIYLVSELAHPINKKRLWFWFYFIIVGTFTFNVSYFFGLAFIFKIYRDTYLRMHEGWIKTARTAPCPKCGRDISIESKSCPYCSIKFKIDPSLEIDPRLSISTPKAMYVAPKGYTPSQGLTKEEKKKFKMIVAGIISIIIVVIVLISIF